MGYFIRIGLKSVLLLILGIINFPIDILNILLDYLFNRTLSSLIFTESEISELVYDSDKDDLSKLNDEDFELWLNKLLLASIKPALVFYITILIIILIL